MTADDGRRGVLYDAYSAFAVLRSAVYGRWSLILSTLLLAACAAPTANITVTDAWARPGLNGENSAIYFEIDNPAREDDLLLSVSSDAAQMVELHMSSVSSDGVMSMTHQDSVVVPAGAQTVFEPGGLHVMMMGLTRELKPGDQVQFTLKFENLGEITAQAEVRAP
jgi:copper(I)-binding protein